MNAPQTNDAAISAAAVLVALATWYQGCGGPPPARPPAGRGPVRQAADLEFATPAAAPDELGRAVPEAGALERGQVAPAVGPAPARPGAEPARSLEVRGGARSGGAAARSSRNRAARR